MPAHSRWPTPTGSASDALTARVILHVVVYKQLRFVFAPETSVKDPRTEEGLQARPWFHSNRGHGALGWCLLCCSLCVLSQNAWQIQKG